MSEFRKGLAETRRYLLSHHERAEWDRCYSVTALGRRLRLCARCTGFYPGIVAGLCQFRLAAHSVPSPLLIALLPLPALVDWALSAFSDRRGYNAVRTGSGALLGYGYGLGLGALFGEGQWWLVAVGAAYAGLAVALWSRE